MKHFGRLILFMAAAALTACNEKVSYDEPFQEEEKGYTFSLTASSVDTEDANTRSTYTDAGVFSWSADDKISVLFNDGVTNKFYTLTNDTGAGSTATFTGVIDAGYSVGSTSGVKWALYPASNNHTFDGTVPTFYIPSETDYSAGEFSANIPMMALGDGDNVFAFKLMGPTYKFTFTGIDDSIDNVKFVMENTSSPGLSGNITVSTDAYIGNYGYFLNFSSSNTKTVSCTRAVKPDGSAEFYVPCRYYGSYTPVISLYDANDLSTPLVTNTATSVQTLTGTKVKRITIPVSGGVWSFTSNYGIDWSSVTATGVGNNENIPSVKATAVGDYIYLYMEVLESALLENDNYDYCTVLQLYLGGGANSADWKWSNNTLYHSGVNFCWLVADGSPATGSYDSNALYNEGHATVHSGTAYYEIKMNRPTAGDYSYLYSDSKAQIGVLIFKNWYYDSGTHEDWGTYYYAPRGGSMLEVTYP